MRLELIYSTIGEVITNDVIFHGRFFLFGSITILFFYPALFVFPPSSEKDVCMQLVILHTIGPTEDYYFFNLDRLECCLLNTRQTCGPIDNTITYKGNLCKDQNVKSLTFQDVTYLVQMGFAVVKLMFSTKHTARLMSYKYQPFSRNRRYISYNFVVELTESGDEGCTLP